MIADVPLVPTMYNEMGLTWSWDGLKGWTEGSHIFASNYYEGFPRGDGPKQNFFIPTES